jgi:hypothetical protein
MQGLRRSEIAGIFLKSTTVAFIGNCMIQLEFIDRFLSKKPTESYQRRRIETVDNIVRQAYIRENNEYNEE